MDASRPSTRASKALEFFRRVPAAPCALYPRPWSLAAAPYYLAEGVENADGHGGYTSICRFDADGVPYTGAGRRRAYHPLVVARYVLRMCTLAALQCDPAAYAAAARAAAALVQSGAQTGVWRPAASPDAMAGGRPSCIVQATAISALVRVHRHDPQLVPGDLLRGAIGALVSPVAAGGTVTYDLGGPFFEEFDSHSHVLNGCVYALWAIYDVIDGLGAGEMVPLAGAVEACLARVVPRYTLANGWSRYALDTFGYAPLSSVHYHRSHIRMFALLHARTGETAYAAAVERWSAALVSRSIKCAVLARKCAQVVWMRDIRRLPLARSVWE